MSLENYRALGRSGLVVSPAALGTMTFGRDGWGSTDDVSGAVFDAYVGAGGNFLDTAEVYGAGRSEELVGRFVAERKLRDRMVIATKFGWNGDPGNPNFGGNGAKNMTPRRGGLAAAARHGLHRPVLAAHLGLGHAGRGGVCAPSPASWRRARSATSACRMRRRGTPPRWRPWPPPTDSPGRSRCNWNIPSSRGRSSASRSAPRGSAASRSRPGARSAVAFFPASIPAKVTALSARDGLPGSIPSPGHSASSPKPTGRSSTRSRRWRPRSTGPCAQVAVAWVAARPAIGSLILGASRVEQLHDTLAGLDLTLTPEQTATLDAASSLEPDFMSRAKSAVFGGVEVQAWA